MVLRSLLISVLIAVLVSGALLLPRKRTPAPMGPVNTGTGSLSVSREGEQKPPIMEEERVSLHLAKEPRAREVSAGAQVRIHVEVENTGESALTDITAQEQLDTSLIRIVDAGGGTIEQHRITWHIEELPAGKKWSATYALRIPPALPPQNLEATLFVYGKSIQSIPSAKRLLTHTLTIVPLPKTGVDFP